MLDSIAPQVDRINVYLDGHETVPDCVQGDKYNVQHVTDRTKSMRAAGKFFWADDLEDCYHVTSDDDILYPPDYVEKMIAAIERHERRAVVGVHAIRFHGPPYRFYKNRVNYSMGLVLPEDMQVHALGTGTLMYWTGTWRVNRADFPEYNAEDLFVAICAKRQGIPLICVAREAGWLKAQPVHTWSIYGQYLETQDDSWQTKYMVAEAPWPTLRLPQANHDAIQRWFAMRVYGQ